MPRSMLSRRTWGWPAEAVPAGRFPGLTFGLSETVEGLELFLGERIGDRDADRGGGFADGLPHHVQGGERIKR